MMQTLLKYFEDPDSKIEPDLSCREVGKRHNSSDWNGPFWIKPSERGPSFKVSTAERQRTRISKNKLSQGNNIHLLILLYSSRRNAMLRKDGL